MADTSPGIRPLILDLAHRVIAAIADRPNESPEQCAARAQEAIRHIEAYEPRTPLEIMLAAQAVLFQNLALDAAWEANRAEMPDEARRFRQQATGLGRMQMSYVKEFNRGRAAAARQAKDAARANAAAPPAREAAAQAPRSAQPAPAVEAAPSTPPSSQAMPPAPARDVARKSDGTPVGNPVGTPAVPRPAINEVLPSTPPHARMKMPEMADPS